MEYNHNSIDQMKPSEIPPEVKKWNWGAFSLNIFWGIGNKSYLALLCLIPLFNFVWVFVCGAKGNSWAWKAGNYSYDNLDEFLAIQSTWNRAGIVCFILNIIPLIFVLLSVLPVLFSIL